MNTWDNSGNFYVCVRGRNGVFEPASNYHLEVTLLTGDCGSVEPLPPSTLAAVGGGFKTVIVTDFSRLPGSATEQDALRAKLATFAGRSEVKGQIVDVGTDHAVQLGN